MTREEAIALMKRNADGYYPKMTEALNMAIEALSTETCDDAVSRQAVIKTIKEVCNPYGKPQIDFEVGKKMIEWFKAMPSVQPVSPKGKWEEWIDRNDYNDFESISYVCNKCHHIQYAATNFCSNCGADMRGEG